MKKKIEKNAKLSLNNDNVKKMKIQRFVRIVLELVMLKF